LDVSGAKKNKGATLIYWSYHGGPNQQFKIHDEKDGYVSLEPLHAPGMRLSIGGQAVHGGGLDLYLDNCNHKDSQKIKSDIIEDQIFLYFKSNQNKVFDVADYSMYMRQSEGKVGTKVYLSDKHLSINQRWTLKLMVKGNNNKNETQINKYTNNISDIKKYSKPGY